jgi:hypothetical protein
VSTAHARSRIRSPGSWPPSVDWILLVIVAVAAVVRFWSLRQSLWYDEYVTTNVIFKGTKLVSNLNHQEGTPPLYFVLAWGWTKVFGAGDATLRSMSAVVGTATVPVAYAAARELAASRRVARIAAALVAVNPMLVWFSQEARAYALFAFIAAASLLFWARAYMRGGQTRDLVLWGIASAAAVSTHYFAAFLILPQAVWLLVTLRTRRRQVIVGCVPMFLAGPLLYIFFFRPQSDADLQQWVASSPLHLRVGEAGRQALMGPGGWDDRLWLAAAALIVGGAVLVGVRANRRERSVAATMAVLGGTAVVLALVASAIGDDYFLGRNLIGSLVPLAIAVAIGFGARRAGWVGLAAAAALCALSTGIVVTVDRTADLQKTDWRSLAAVLDANPRDSLIVIDHDAHLAKPLLRYLKSARLVGLDDLVPVQEIDLVYHVPKHVDRCGFFQGRVCEPAVFYFPVFPEALSHRFIYSGKPRVAQFAVNQYRPAGTLAVRPWVFVRTPRQKNFAVILRQKPLRR